MANAHRPRFRALTNELEDAGSPVRQFFDKRFAAGLRDVQREYRPAGDLVVPSTKDVNPGTIGTAADWLMRFLLHPAPDVRLAMEGAAEYVGPKLMFPVADLADLLDARRSPVNAVAGDEHDYQQAVDAGLVEAVNVDRPKPSAFAGPSACSQVDADMLARGCWALALLTDLFRAGPVALAHGPLCNLNFAKTTAADLLALAPAAAVDQLARFRRLFERRLIPWLADRRGSWALGPTFAGSTLIGGADADLIAAGLLLDLKTTTKLSLRRSDLWQLIGYVLLDFTNEYQLDNVGMYFARYDRFVTWDLQMLIDALAARPIDLEAARTEFKQMLQTRVC